MKIAICGLVKSENLGEMFIARSLEYLIEKELHEKEPSIEVEFVEVDLLGRNDELVPATNAMDNRIKNYYGFDKHATLEEYLFVGLRKCALKMRKHKKVANIIYRFRHFVYLHGKNQGKRLCRYFSDKMYDVDFIVVDGAGLLEYAYNEYQEPLLLISRYAEEHGLPVVYNAIGQAGSYDEKDFRSSILRDALRNKAVKYVSARDSVENVQACAGEDKQVKLLADAAFWMKEAYDVEPRRKLKKVGIGLIRGNSLTGYGYHFGREKWVDLFSAIALELERRGYSYEFFTNGLPGDIVLGKKVLERLGLSEEYMVERPIKDTELYTTIAGYEALITCRMHSSIAAFTLGTPSVILSWNDKVEKLMEIIGYPERAIKRDEFEAGLIVDRLEAAICAGVDKEKTDRMKSLALESVKDYIDLIIESAKQ